MKIALITKFATIWEYHRMISFYFFVPYFRLLLFEFIRIHQIIVICYDFVLCCSFITASVERYLIINIHHIIWDRRLGFFIFFEM
jgi:hypothetical protein